MAVIVVDVMSTTVAINVIVATRTVMVVISANYGANAVTVTGAV